MTYRGGKEKRVNTFTANNQSDAHVAALDDGGWMVTWSSYAEDGSGYGIYQQRYVSGGAKVGGETLVPTTTAGPQDFSDMTGLADGGWVVTWSSRPAVNAADFEIRIQAYNADGSKQGSETQVNATSAGTQVHSSVAALSSGGWVVTWQGDDPDTSNGDSKTDIYQQLFNSSGQKVGGETMVNSFTTSDQFDSKVTALDTGGWVVTWASFGHAADSSGIYAQVYQANGAKLGGEIHVNTFTSGNQHHPDITTLKNGDFVITWESQDEDGSGYGIYQQRFNADGSFDGGEKRVNKTTALAQDSPDVTALSNGGYVVTWQSEKQDGSAYGIVGQVYDADGHKLGKEILINRHTNSEQTDPSVAALDGGKFVVSWESFDVDGSGGAIVQRVFSNAGAKLSSEKLILDFRPVIEGNGKDNVLDGKDIGEKIYGRGGDDTINGHGGNDLLDGGKGDDLLIGGDGKDLFVFKTGYGTDTIRGFFEGDRVDLRGLQGIDGFDDLIANHASQFGADIRIEGEAGDVLYIRHGNLGTLEETDFLFAT
jgi:hypothetical protein